MDLLDRVRATIRRQELIRPGTRIIVALSGGPDSVALSWLLHALAEGNELAIAGLAHLNHRLRPEADADAAFCADLARRLGLPFEVAAIDVSDLAARKKLSLETAAHTARYRFLQRAAARLGAERIALGHTMDDQAETVLLRLLRGAGRRGLSGMHPRHGPFVRPLLEIRRAELCEYLEVAGQPFVIDLSNEDRRIPRNRIRMELLPRLVQDFNPRIVEVLAGAADVAREEWRWLEAAGRQLVADAAAATTDGWLIQADVIGRAPLALARIAMRLILEQASGGRPITLRHVSAALELCGANDGTVDLPGQRVQRIGAQVVLRKRHTGAGRSAEIIDGQNFFAHSLSIPGEAAIADTNLVISAELARSVRGHEAVVDGRGDIAVVQAPELSGPWAVRNRRPGDRIGLPGLSGRKKLQDLFVDRKVPRADRDRVPIVVDDRDRIVWVVGHGVAREFRVTNRSQAVIILRLNRGGLA
jgi:tRNA(Ile)-lysidine synthase